MECTKERSENMRVRRGRFEQHRMAKFLLLLLCVCFMCPLAVEAKSKTEVEKRIERVQKEYPNKSTFDGYVSVPGFTGGGCNGLVMYTTLKVFHNVYTPECDTYKHIGKSTSTKNTTALKNLFKKAKIGDVVRFRNGDTDAHYAIFLSDTSEGVYLYEGNFGGPNVVRVNNFWRWSVMKTWPAGGATKVDIYRAKNYDKVNKKKSAKNIAKGKAIEVDGLKYVVTKNSGFGGEVKLVGVVEDYYYDATIKVPNYIFVDNMSEKGLNCNYSGEASYGNSENLNYQLTYKVTAIGNKAFDNKPEETTKVEIGSNVNKIGSNAFRGISVIKIKSKNLKTVSKKAFSGTADNLVIKVPSSKYKKYKKLLANKGQSSSAVIKK